MKFVLLLCFGVGVVFSQVPKPCNSPPQWEGREVSIDYSHKYENRRHIHYDEINMRTRTFSEVEIGDTREYYDHLLLYKENKNYTINTMTRTCALSNITGTFHYRGVHPNATYDTVISLGATGIRNENVPLAIFSANETTEFYTGIVTYPHCIPVQSIHITKEFGYEHSDYYDIKAGIGDPSVFTPPPECNKLHR